VIAMVDSLFHANQFRERKNQERKENDLFEIKETNKNI
jgi:hypothetical protein